MYVETRALRGSTLIAALVIVDVFLAVFCGNISLICELQGESVRVKGEYLETLV